MQMQNVDVVIVGGGMVGLGLAAALKQSGLKIAIVEGQLPEPQLGEAPDNRVSALSLASQRILQQVGAWAGIEARRLQPYEKMQVWEQDSFGQIGFDAASLRPFRQDCRHAWKMPSAPRMQCGCDCRSGFPRSLQHHRDHSPRNGPLRNCRRHRRPKPFQSHA